MNTLQNALSSDQITYSEFMRFMNKVSDGENSQQLIDTWSELTSQTDQIDATLASPQASASAPAANVTDTPSTSATNEEGDWVRDFAEHKSLQG